MTAKKLYRYLLLAFFAGLILSGMTVKYASSWLAESSTELNTLRSETLTLEQKRSDLESAQLTLKKDAATIEILDDVVPDDKDQARIISVLYKIAEEAGITIESVGFPASTLGSETPKPAAAATTQANDSTSTSTSQTTTAPSTSSPISQATPVKDIPGLQSIDLTLGTINSRSLPAGSGVKYDELVTFLKLIERNKRAIQIKSLGIGRDSVVDGIETFSLDIALTIYIRP